MTPRPLLTARGEVRTPVTRVLRSARRIAVFLDYDGTLTRIRPTPEEAVLSPRARRVLRLLARHPRTRTAIVSGRALADVRQMVGIPGLTMIGGHGLHMERNGRIWMHPSALRARPFLRSALRILRRRLGGIRGIRFQDKQVGLAVHLRAVASADRLSVRNAVHDIADANTGFLRMVRGKQVLELRPASAWSKGDAVAHLLRRMPRTVGVFLGDDVTDEDAFRALQHSGITVRVGRRQTTSAHFFVPGVGGVLTFLEHLASLPVVADIPHRRAPRFRGAVAQHQQ